jgi:hypothetical protein
MHHSFALPVSRRFLERVVVERLSDHAEWHFPCALWLSRWNAVDAQARAATLYKQPCNALKPAVQRATNSRATRTDVAT